MPDPSKYCCHAIGPALICFFLPVCYTLAISCDRTAEESYRKKIERWHQERIASLKEDDSWLSLAGLYRLEEGLQTVGADSANDIIFPNGKAPGRIGFITLSGDSLVLNLSSDAEIEVAGRAVRDSSEIPLLVDIEPNGPTTMAYGSLEWYVIERGGAYFVRLKDSRNPHLSNFKGIDRYPVSPEWRVEAVFNAFDEPREITVPNVLGQENRSKLYGTLQFHIDGESYELAPLGDPDGDSFFIIFGDRTNGETTYGGGRFVYADTPGKDGTTHIDFNKAYNPPCVFNEFATCPLPPVQNRLQEAITAGEKNYGTSGTH